MSGPETAAAQPFPTIGGVLDLAALSQTDPHGYALYWMGRTDEQVARLIEEQDEDARRSALLFSEAVAVVRANAGLAPRDRAADAERGARRDRRWTA